MKRSVELERSYSVLEQVGDHIKVHRPSTLCSQCSKSSSPWRWPRNKARQQSVVKIGTESSAKNHGESGEPHLSRWVRSICRSRNARSSSGNAAKSGSESALLNAALSHGHTSSVQSATSSPRNGRPGNSPLATSSSGSSRRTPSELAARASGGAWAARYDHRRGDASLDCLRCFETDTGSGLTANAHQVPG